MSEFYLFHPVNFIMTLRYNPYFYYYVFNDNNHIKNNNTKNKPIDNINDFMNSCLLVKNKTNLFKFDNLLDKNIKVNNSNIYINEQYNFKFFKKLKDDDDINVSIYNSTDDKYKIVVKKFKNSDLFMKESSIINIFSKNNICNNYVIDNYSIKKYEYVLMSYGDGDLYDLFKNENIVKKSLYNALFIFKKIIICYNCIYKNLNLIYTDIKLQNIVWKCEIDSPDIKILLIDFGAFNFKDDKYKEYTFPSIHLLKSNNLTIKETVYQLGILFINILLLFFESNKIISGEQYQDIVKKYININLLSMLNIKFGGGGTMNNTMNNTINNTINNTMNNTTSNTTRNSMNNTTSNTTRNSMNMSNSNFVPEFLQVNNDRTNNFEDLDLNKYLKIFIDDIENSLKSKNVNNDIINEIITLINKCIKFNPEERFDLDDLESKIKYILNILYE